MRAKIDAIRTALCGSFFEREREASGLLVALLSRQHMLMLGPPGTSKSAIVNATRLAISDAQGFAWLFTKFTLPDEVFGPMSLTALKADRFERVPTGKLPEAHVAFLDEIFKASSAILNSLLTISNERVWHNNGHAVQVPLETIVGASNELPESDETAALYDRFLLRYWVEPIRGADAMAKMMLAPEPQIDVTITLAELHAAQQDAARMPIEDGTVESLVELRHELGKLGIQASDRRYKQALKVLRAYAWLLGEKELSPANFDLLADMLWSEPAQRPKIVDALKRFEDSDATEAQAALDAIKTLVQQLPPGGSARADAIVRVAHEARRADERIDGIYKNANDRAKKAVRRVREEAARVMAPIRLEARANLKI